MKNIIIFVIFIEVLGFAFMKFMDKRDEEKYKKCASACVFGGSRDCHDI